jgi:hypothetical protein
MALRNASTDDRKTVGYVPRRAVVAVDERVKRD